MSQKTSDPGVLLAFMGLPGSGKSSVAQELSRLCNAGFFGAEPEADSWPDAVRYRALSGQFTAITWFRCRRVPQLYLADNCRRLGRLAIVDSYYDKLFHYYLGTPGFEWLISPTDPYFGVMKHIAEVDLEHLPNADCIVFLQVTLEIWLEFLRRRNRETDSDEELLQSYDAQNMLLSAVDKYARENHIRTVVQLQEASTPATVAKALRRKLLSEKIITG